MKIEGKSVVVTGGAGGIGLALARRFRAEGARGIALADLQEDSLLDAAGEIDALAVPCDVADEADIKRLVAAAEDAFGAIDVFVSNAGIARMGGVDAPDEEWRQNWDIHVMAHVYAARAVAPKMAARGSGYLVNTASAAGLLSHVESATYSVTKHAAVAFAEWLSIVYGDQGCGSRCSARRRSAPRCSPAGTRASPAWTACWSRSRWPTASSRRWSGRSSSSFPTPRCRTTWSARPRITRRWLRGMRKLRAAHGGAP